MNTVIFRKARIKIRRQGAGMFKMIEGNEFHVENIIMLSMPVRINIFRCSRFSKFSLIKTPAVRQFH